MVLSLLPLVADGLFTRETAPSQSDPPKATFHLLPECPIKPLEELFRAKVIRFLESQNLLPPERARSLRSWVHSGFNVHAGDWVEPEAKAELADLAQYILRNPFSVEKMILESPTDNVIYRSRMSVKINRNFQIFSPTDFLAAITQHIPDKGVQMVRYYGWYSNKMRVIAVIDQRVVVEKFLRHLGLWTGIPALASAHCGVNSSSMRPTQKQFSLTGASLEKGISYQYHITHTLYSGILPKQQNTPLSYHNPFSFRYYNRFFDYIGVFGRIDIVFHFHGITRYLSFRMKKDASY